MKIHHNIILIFILLSTFLPGQDKSNYLKPGINIDSDNPIIIKTVDRILKSIENDTLKLKLLFEFVRDSIDEKNFDSFKASEVLKNGAGYCYKKAILLAALYRAANFPSRISFDKVSIKNYQDSKHQKKDICFLHGITEVYFVNRWIKLDQSGNTKRWRIWTQDDSDLLALPLQFSVNKDVLFSSSGRITVERMDLHYFDWDEKVAKIVANSNKY